MKYEKVDDVMTRIEELFKERGHLVTQEPAGRGDVMYYVAGVAGWTHEDALINAAIKFDFIQVAKLGQKK